MFKDTLKHIFSSSLNIELNKEKKNDQTDSSETPNSNEMSSSMQGGVPAADWRWRYQKHKSDSCLQTLQSQTDRWKMETRKKANTESGSNKKRRV